MATVWTKCRGGLGEQRLAAHLGDLDCPNLILCFSLDFIPGGREIDLLLLHKEIGGFVVEVKALRLGGIRSVSSSGWSMEGRETTDSPLRQAYAQYEGLRNFFHGRTTLPQMAVTTCLPNISRYSWKAAFSEHPYALDISEGCLFSEDLADETILVARLAYIMERPAWRSGRSPRRIEEPFLTLFKSYLQGGVPNVPTLLERERLKKIEASISRNMENEFPPDDPRHAVFFGLPGTGKTFRLMSIGFWHAFNNKKVLFTCFNKTLAADLRRLTSFSEKLAATRHGVEILDVNQLALRCFDANKLSYTDLEGADAWGEMVNTELGLLGDKANIDTYDTILIDEAQDLKTWQLDLLLLHAAEKCTILLAEGTGQELYGKTFESEKWLDKFLVGDVAYIPLSKNFRNIRTQYFVAQAFYEGWPTNDGEIEKIWQSLFGKKKRRTKLDKKDAGPLFERPDGEPLKLILIPQLEGEFEDEGRNQNSIVANEYLQILRGEVESMKQDENSKLIGLLVLVPTTGSVHATCVRLALDLLIQQQPDVAYIDYTKETSRRRSAQSNEVRLCTFHSARGLEGDRVVIFGLEQLQHLSENTATEGKNLAFIALSRGIFATSVVLRSTFVSPSHRLLKEILRTQQAHLLDEQLTASARPSTTASKASVQS